MTDEEIIGLAIDCDVAFAHAKPQRKALLNFARVVATKEREECARVAETFDFNERQEIEPPRTIPRYVAAAIRERSNV